LAAFVAAATDSRSDSVAPFFATAAKYDSGCAAAAACALAGERGKAAVPAAVSVVCFDAAFAAAATRRLARVGEEWAEFDADGDDVADFGAAADAAAEDADDDPDDAAVSGAESGDECAHWGRDDGSESVPLDATIDAKDGGCGFTGGCDGGGGAAGEAARDVVGRVGAWAEGRVGCGCGGTDGDAVSAVAKWRTGHSGVSENR
jgi:hypothetical protein